MMFDLSSALTPDKTYGVYIHIPFCKSKCAYCAFVSTPDFSLKQSYIDALVREIRDSSARGAKVDTVYIGGGTPSCLFGEQLLEIIGAVRETFDVSDDAEITAEANPESCNDDFVRACIECGVDRVSMGLQSSDDRVLKAIGRIHRYEDFVAAAERLVTFGIQNVSSDIILGLPGQTPTDVEKCVRAFDKYCTHASVYALGVEEGTPLYERGYRPDDDHVADLYDSAVSELRSFGFSRYEVSNFSRNGKISRHNTKYWTFMPYLGFGVAAHGFDGKRTRYAHGDDMEKYIRGEAPTVTELSEKDVYNEYIMLALRTERGIDLCDFTSRFGCEFTDMANEELDKLTGEGAIVCTRDFVKIPADKMFVMNGIIERLMM